MTEAQTKKVDRRYMLHLANLLRPILEERFQGNGTAFAKAVGVSQSQLSQLLRTDIGDRGVGIVVLIKLREYLKISIDDMLGLRSFDKKASKESADADRTVLADEARRLLREEIRVLREEEAALARSGGKRYALRLK